MTKEKYRLEIFGKTLGIIESAIRKIRDDNKESLHPWAFNPLANAIGSIQAARSQLRAVKKLIEPRNDPQSENQESEK